MIILFQKSFFAVIRLITGIEIYFFIGKDFLDNFYNKNKNRKNQKLKIIDSTNIDKLSVPEKENIKNFGFSLPKFKSETPLYFLESSGKFVTGARVLKYSKIIVENPKNCVIEIPKDKAFIRGIQTLREERGKGYAKIFIARLIKYLSKEHVNGLYAHILGSNAVSSKMFWQMKFKYKGYFIVSKKNRIIFRSKKLSKNLIFVSQNF
jgi:hypothetical protein